MKSAERRMEEFVQYHINGDGECNTVVLVSWAKRNGLNAQARFELAYFFSITYSVVSAIVLYKERDDALNHVNLWARENKQKLIFQSDRKYMRMKDNFQKSMSWFAEHRSVEHFYEKTHRNGVLDMQTAIDTVQQWPMFGRFSAFLFLEMYSNLEGVAIQNTTIEWECGNTATSGLLNLFGYDEEANLFDKNGVLALPKEQCDELLQKLICNIKHHGGSTNITEVETSLCAYRKFYKGSRYNGYYLDRMLDEINKACWSQPEITREILEIRRENFADSYLGELNGWKGIRRELKPLYRNTGIVT